MALTIPAEPRGWRLRVAVNLLALAAWCKHQLWAERFRWSLWLAPAVGLGVAGYFALPGEPPPWTSAVGFAAAVAVARLGKPAPILARVAALAAAALALGFCAAQLRTAWVAAPVLSAAHGPTAVVGTVERIQADGDRRRYVLAKARVSGLAAGQTPQRLRVSTAAQGSPVARPGDRVRVRAKLLPPPGPAVPGGYDFQRRAYFDRLGAVGYAVGDVKRLKQGDGGGLASARNGLRREIAAHLPQPAEGLAVALLTGQRGHLTESAETAMRHAGLAHLLAISGLHVGLVVALIFGGLRRAAALVPPVVLRLPGKKLAAALALLAAGAYTAFVGAPVPTLRAYVMAAIVLAAVLGNRQPISMRLVAVAAGVVLLAQPEAILSASFQLSFAAVAALVAAYELLQPRIDSWRAVGGWRRPAVYLAAVALSSLIATGATALFVVAHFQRLALFGVAANMVAVPVTAFWVMPWGLASYALAPLGLAEWALAPMGWGLEAIVATARAVSAWPGAVVHLPAPPGWALGVGALGGCWLVIWQQRWRWLGLGPLVVALGLGFGQAMPLLEIDRDGAGVGLRGPDSKLWLPRDGGVSAYVAQAWRSHRGPRVIQRYDRNKAKTAGRWLTCDGAGCVLRRGGYRIAVLRDGRLVRSACRRSDLVVVLAPRRQPCPGSRVIGPGRLDRTGAISVYATSTGLRLETAQSLRGARPWVLGAQGQ